MVTRERLIDEVWDTNWFGSTKTLDVHVSSLRRKLGDDSADPRFIHTVRGVGFRFAAPDELAMSLRARLLLAFAYVLVLVIVALEVPLALNLSKRVDAEIKSEAQGQAQLLAAGAPGRLDDRDQLQSLVESSDRDLGGSRDRGGRGRRAAGRLGRRGERRGDYSSRPEIARALDGDASQGERRSHELDQDLLFTAVPIVVDGRPDGRGPGDPERRRRESRGSQRRDRADRRRRGRAAARPGAWPGCWPGRSPSRCATSPRARAGWRAATSTLAPRSTGSTEQKEVATAFNDMTGRLGRSLRSQREFVANASHQLRTPLTGPAAAPRGGRGEVGPGGGQGRARRGRARDRAPRASACPSCSRWRASASGRRPEPVDVGDAAAAAGERWLGPSRRSGHELAIDDGDPVEVCSSVEDVAVMLDNLIENALHYSPAGTRVTIGWRTEGRQVRIGVTDEGPGIDEDEREQVFERFYRGSASGGAPGTGLGLNVVEALAKRWDGEATLTQPGRGRSPSRDRAPRPQLLTRS